MNENNPYAAPSSTVADARSPLEAAPALWNPNAAASWSLLFSPIFGAWLQMYNWQALGDEAQARISKYWAIGSALAFGGIFLLAVLLPETHVINKITNRSGIILLLAWYFSHGKAQAKVVADRFGKDYPRKSWGKPLGFAVLGVIAFIVVAVVLGIAVAALGRD